MENETKVSDKVETEPVEEVSEENEGKEEEENKDENA